MLVHHPHYVAPLPDGHRFPMNKYGLLREELMRRGTWQRVPVVQPEPAPRGWLEAAHSPAYVSQILDRTLDAKSARRIGFDITERVVKRARLSCAGTYLAAQLALEHGLACQTAGGSHHAHHDFGSGYCVFNDVAVAAAMLRTDAMVDRILIVDLDVHHGDGTATIFSGEPSIFTFSVHGEKNFPTRKPAGDLDIGLPDGTSDQAYLEVIAEHLSPLIDHHQPEIIFYNAGVDPHEKDRLGRLSLSEQGLMARDRLVIETARARHIPLVTVLGGGYGEDRDRVARLHANSIDIALSLST